MVIVTSPKNAKLRVRTENEVNKELPLFAIEIGVGKLMALRNDFYGAARLPLIK